MSCCSPAWQLMSCSLAWQAPTVQALGFKAAGGGRQLLWAAVHPVQEPCSPVDVSTVSQVWVVSLLGGIGQHKLDHLLGTLRGLLQEKLHRGSHQLQLDLQAPYKGGCHHTCLAGQCLLKFLFNPVIMSAKAPARRVQSLRQDGSWQGRGSAVHEHCMPTQHRAKVWLLSHERGVSLATSFRAAPADQLLCQQHSAHLHTYLSGQAGTEHDT